jgi:hypothetical protein
VGAAGGCGEKVRRYEGGKVGRWGQPEAAVGKWESMKVGRWELSEARQREAVAEATELEVSLLDRRLCIRPPERFGLPQLFAVPVVAGAATG